MNKSTFSSLFRVGERIASGNPENPRSSAFLELIAIEEAVFRYKSVRNQQAGKFSYSYLAAVVHGLNRIDPFSIQKTMQPVLLEAGYSRNISTENYAYGFAREVIARIGTPFLSTGEILDSFDDLHSKELTQGLSFTEGATMRVLVDRQERSSAARLACIREHGAIRKACGFSFTAFYGLIGKNFVHVHHVIPLSSVKESKLINPARELVPLCANCHAMVHTSDPPLSVSQLQEIIATQERLI